MRFRALLPPAATIAVLLGPAVPPAAAQDAPAEATPAPSPAPAKRGQRPGDVQKVFVLKHVRADDMADLLMVFPVEISHVGRETSQLLAVSGAPAVVAAVEETIKRLDVPAPPPKNVEVKGYLLECSAKGTEPGDVSTELQAVVAQLKRALAYSSCSQVQTLFTRASVGSHFQAMTDVGRNVANERDSYTLTSVVEVSSSETGPIIQFRHLSFIRSGGARGSISNDVEVRDGQRVVLGKLGSLEGSKDQIFVLTAKVVD